MLVGLLSACAGTTTESPGPEVPGADARCDRALALEVLGSGGPILDDGRASSGYLLWEGGRARVLVDAGGGVAARFAESGAQVADLDAVLVSHLHVDHSVDLAAFLKSAELTDRRKPLTLAGPAGNTSFPAFIAFLDLLVGRGGAYRYLRDQLERGIPYPLIPKELATSDGAEVVPLPDAASSLRIRAVGVPHGPVPALGYEVTVGGKRIVFGGDQRLDAPAFEQLSEGADLLVLHVAIPENASEAAARLHARPSRIAAFVEATRPKQVVLSHLMARSLPEVAGLARRLRALGPEVAVAEDHLCVTF